MSLPTVTHSWFFLGKRFALGSFTPTYLVEYDIPALQSFPADCAEVGQIFAQNYGPITAVLNPPTLPTEDCATATKILSSYS